MFIVLHHLQLIYSLFRFFFQTLKCIFQRSAGTVFDIIKDLFKFLIKNRTGSRRIIFYLCLIIIALHDDMMQGTATILYLFTSKKFAWSISEFATYSAIQLISTMSGMLFLAKVIAPLLGKLPQNNCFFYIISIIFDINLNVILIKTFSRYARNNIYNIFKYIPLFWLNCESFCSSILAYVSINWNRTVCFSSSFACSKYHIKNRWWGRSWWVYNFLRS